MKRVWIALILVASLAANAWLAVRLTAKRDEGAPRQPATTQEESAPSGGTEAPGSQDTPAAARDPHDLLDSVERGWLERAGLKEPAAALRSDLMGHPELIAGEGIVGGTMAFRSDQIWVLPGGHVWAVADDGHIEIMMLLTYRVSRDGKITWSPAYHHAP